MSDSKPTPVPPTPEQAALAEAWWQARVTARIAAGMDPQLAILPDCDYQVVMWKAAHPDANLEVSP